MAAEFLRRLIRRASPPPPEVRSALEELARLGQERPSLAGPAALLADILAGLYDELSPEKIPALATEHATAKLVGGIPLLRGEDVTLNRPALKKRYLHVCAAIRRHQGKNGQAAHALAETVRRGRLEPAELLRGFLAGRPEELQRQAEMQGVDGSLAVSTLRLAVVPALAQISAGLEALRANAPWERGFCPTCGSGPLLGEFRGLEQARFLRCGFCTTSWPFPRLRCPFCETADYQVVGYFHVEGEEGKYRAATCEACNRYVKTLSTLTPLSGPQLVVADLATAHLDLAAAERGYGP